MTAMLAGQARAQQVEPISANRPGFNETTSMLGHGQLQIELSGNVDHMSSTASVWSEPFHLRAGLTDRFELRVHGNGVLRVSDGPDVTTGMSDLTLGAAWHASSGGGIIPASALVGYVSLPSGSRETRGVAASPSAYLPLSWSLASGRALAVMPGVAVVDEGDGYFTAGALSGAVSQAVGERLVLFGEVAGESLRSAAHGGSTVTTGGGAAIRVRTRHQVDVGFARRLTTAGPTLRLYVGVSSRLRD